MYVPEVSLYINKIWLEIKRGERDLNRLDSKNIVNLQDEFDFLRSKQDFKFTNGYLLY